MPKISDFSSKKVTLRWKDLTRQVKICGTVGFPFFTEEDAVIAPLVA